MFRLTFLICMFLFICSQGFGQTSQSKEYSISIAIEGWTDPTAFLGYYINESTYIQDTAQVINGKVLFEGSEKLISGLYFLYTPNNLFFEFIVNEPNFSLSSTIDDVSGNMVAEGSEENTHFFSYQNKMLSFQKEAKELTPNDGILSPSDSLIRLEKLREINKKVKAIQLKERDEHRGTYFSEFLSLIIRPEIVVPENLAVADASKYRLNEYKSQFWNGVNFSNPGIIRNPVFEPKMNEYFDKLVYSQADSLNKEIDAFLTRKMDSTVFRYIVVTLTNKYATSKIMTSDGVFVHMVNDYYATGKAYWVDNVTLTRMKQNSERLQPILIGKKAPVFISEDFDGNHINNPFSTTDKDYKILFFYDSGCGHCKKAAPKLMASYKALEKSNISAEIISMNLSPDKVEWEVFIKTYGLGGITLGDTQSKSNGGYYYKVETTPQIFVIDGDNKIIGKKIGAEFVDDFLIQHVNLKGQK